MIGWFAIKCLWVYFFMIKKRKEKKRKKKKKERRKRKEKKKETKATASTCSFGKQKTKTTTAKRMATDNSSTGCCFAWLFKKKSIPVSDAALPNAWLQQATHLE